MQKNSTIRFALAQINTTVGDLSGNLQKIKENLHQARVAGCHLVAFPELSISGYPPEDLVLREQFVRDQRAVLDKIVQEVSDFVAVVGFVDRRDGRLYNAAAVIQDRAIRAVYHKIQLPNYSVFDEERYFEAGDTPLVITLNGIKIGINICEDIWIPDCVIETEAFLGGAEVLLNISASPYAASKGEERIDLVRERAQNTNSIILYNNLVGGQDELIFDGQSLIVSPDGAIWHYGTAFAEEMIFYDVDVSIVRERRHEAIFLKRKNDFIATLAPCEQVQLADEQPNHNRPIKRVEHASLSLEAEVYKAICLGLHDYVAKNGFEQVVFGLSGGIDSALVATIAADALGPKNVNCVTMPSHFSSKGSVDDSVQLAHNLGINFTQHPIKDIFDQYVELFKETFAGLPEDVAEENLQARIRGNIVMALSNKFSWLPLATGNKSEVSVGYCTIYGDMVGGFSPLKDVFKTMVYRLADYRNSLAGYDLIPRAIIDKAPSAELRPNQTDQDSLPPYDELDQILEWYVEKQKGVDEIIALGFDAATVKKVARLVDVNEYKRRQAAPGVKITALAFGKDRRMPITNHYKGQ